MKSTQNMDPNRNANATPEELDQLLAAHFIRGEELAPSSGFALSVMESIRAETCAPPPIAFPWKRALPGVIALLCAMTGFAVLLLRLRRNIVALGVPSTGASTVFLSTHMEIFHLTRMEQAGCWIAVAMLLSLLATTGSMRIARGR